MNKKEINKKDEISFKKVKEMIDTIFNHIQKTKQEPNSKEVNEFYKSFEPVLQIVKRYFNRSI